MELGAYSRKHGFTDASYGVVSRSQRSSSVVSLTFSITPEERRNWAAEPLSISQLRDQPVTCSFMLLRVNVLMGLLEVDV
jgi:hypothetical protein